MSVGFFFNTMFNVVDTWCAGSLGTDALAGVALVFPLYFIWIAFANGIGQGATALIANEMGAGREGEVGRIYVQAIGLVMAMSLVLLGLGWWWAEGVLRWLGAVDGGLEQALKYFRVLMVGGTLLMLPLVVNSLLVASGETKSMRNFLVVGCLINVVLNPILMKGWWGLPEMGVAGIALATVLIQGGGAIYLGVKVSNTLIGKGLGLELVRWDGATLLKLLKQAGPAVLNMLTIALGVMVITYYVSPYGSEAVAAVGIGTRIEQILLMPTLGLNAATLSLVGQSYGAGLMDRVRMIWVKHLQYSLVMSGIGAVLMLLFGNHLLGLFSADEKVLSYGQGYLRSAAVAIFTYPILFVTVSAMQGVKRSMYGLWMGVYRQLVAPLILFECLAIVLGWGADGVWWGIAGVNWSAALAALYLGRKWLG
jgi:putative MATE family efflux protein